MVEHFNTKIKGEITGNHSGEFEIRTEFGQLSVNMKKVNNQLTIVINSQFIDELKDQIKNMEKSILEKRKTSGSLGRKISTSKTHRRIAQSCFPGISNCHECKIGESAIK